MGSVKKDIKDGLLLWRLFPVSLTDLSDRHRDERPASHP